MMTNIERMLRRLEPGDIFHADAPYGASLICLITRVDDDMIYARRVTTQHDLTFCRRTGKERTPGVKGLGQIDSIAPLPIDIHAVMLGLDRRYRLVWGLENARLSREEKAALVFIATHYPENPLSACETADLSESGSEDSCYACGKNPSAGPSSLGS